MSEIYQEYKTPQQSNINFNESFKMGVKAPLIADRIFETYSQANAYVKDQASSAVAGLIVSVIKDGERNGIYYVNNVDETTVELALYRQETQSDWLETIKTSAAYIKHRPTTDYGCFAIDPNGVVTETPYAQGYMDYEPPEN